MMAANKSISTPIQAGSLNVRSNVVLVVEVKIGCRYSLLLFEFANLLCGK